MGLKYHSIPSRAESDNPMDGACVLISPARLRLGICMAVDSSQVAGIKSHLVAGACLVETAVKSRKTK
jgi:hypothetical protein